MNVEELSKYIVEYCQSHGLTKVYICGNSGSGKTTLSKKLRDLSLENGNVNLLSMDDFMANETLKASSINKWIEDGIEYEGRYTSSNVESYFLKNVYELLYNIDNGLDCYYFPRRYKEKNNIRKLYSNYFLTIIEGMGTAFLEKDKNKSLSILLKCDKDVQIRRMEERTKQLKRDSRELYDEKRASQYRVNILVKQDEFDIVIVNDKDFNYKIVKEVC